MNKSLRSVEFAIVLALSIISIQASAYETDTHEVLEKHAISQSVLSQDPTIFSDLGFYPWGTNIYYSSKLYGPLTAAGLMDFGVVWEDDEYNFRAFNHFFDPQFNAYAGRGLQVLGIVNGNSSPDWILEDLHDEFDNYGGNPKTCANTIVRLANCPQEFSYKKAQQALANALTLQDDASRRDAESKVLQMLGHITHHIQDMAQPQHTRNDQHLHPLANTNPVWSYYEVRTQKKNSDIDAMLSNTTYPVPSFKTARQYWYTPASPTTKYPQFVGMAEFTAQNFTSFGTQYVASAVDKTFIGPSPGFPYPDGSNHDGSKKQIVRQATPALQDVNGLNIPAGTADFVRGSIYDGYTNATSPPINLATPSLLFAFNGTGTASAQPAFVENTLIYDAEYPILLPRAVAFSAGLINHFFRGRLNLAPVTSNPSAWTLTNVSSEDMNGVFSVYAEDANKIRTRIWSSILSVQQGTSSPISFSPPFTAKKLVAVFQGQLGLEGDPTLATGFYDVAGKVIVYTPPAPQISFPLSMTVTPGSAFQIPYSTLYADSVSFKCTSNGAVFETYSSPTVLASGAFAFTANWTGKSLVCVFSFSGPGGTATATTTVTIVAAPPPTKEIVIVGSSWDPRNRPGSERAFRWSSKTGLQQLRLGNGGLYSVAWGVSPDGKTVVGATTGIVVNSSVMIPINNCAYSGDECIDLGFQTPPFASFIEVPMVWAGSNWFPTYLDGTSLVPGVAWLADNNGAAYGIVGGTYSIWSGGYHVSNTTYAPAGPKSADGSIVLTAVNGGEQAAYIQAGITHMLPFASGISSAAHQVVILP